jgi:ATP-dependent phosphofructokinase / diphosphate-dependent phosphofructokinase
MATARRLKIAINTGGGDAPGLNAVIRAATLAALERGHEVWGIRHGYRSLIEDTDCVAMTRDAVRGIGHLGGSILGTANRGDPFHYPTRVGDELVPMDRAPDLVKRFRELGFDALIAIGGDGSMRIAQKLLAAGIPRVIGVPKTIDNDVVGTDITFGFDTAVGLATEAIDRLHTTAESHERVMVVEVMGRHAGWIAVHAGLAGGADAILIPELPFALEPVAQKILQRERRGRTFSIIVVAEGAKPAGGGLTVRDTGDAFRRVEILGGLGEKVAQELGALTGKETRSITLGHLQRGGQPSSADRVLALRFGASAIAELERGADSGMVAMRNDRVGLVALEAAASGTRSVPVHRGIIVSARELGICFGDELPEAFRAA